MSKELDELIRFIAESKLRRQKRPISPPLTSEDLDAPWTRGGGGLLGGDEAEYVKRKLADYGGGESEYVRGGEEVLPLDYGPEELETEEEPYNWAVESALETLGLDEEGEPRIRNRQPGEFPAEVEEALEANKQPLGYSEEELLPEERNALAELGISPFAPTEVLKRMRSRTLERGEGVTAGQDLRSLLAMLGETLVPKPAQDYIFGPEEEDPELAKIRKMLGPIEGEGKPQATSEAAASVPPSNLSNIIEQALEKDKVITMRGDTASLSDDKSFDFSRSNKSIGEQANIEAQERLNKKALEQLMQKAMIEGIGKGVGGGDISPEQGQANLSVLRDEMSQTDQQVEEAALDREISDKLGVEIPGALPKKLSPEGMRRLKAWFNRDKRPGESFEQFILRNRKKE